MFDKRLEKALSQELTNEKDIVNYCKKEVSKNYSDKKAHDFQCICEYLCYKLKNDVTFPEYQQILFNEIFGGIK